MQLIMFPIMLFYTSLNELLLMALINYFINRFINNFLINFIIVNITHINNNIIN